MPSEAVTRPSQVLSDDTLLEMYRLMLLSRRLDERAWALHRQGRVQFHVSAMGHEATQVGAAFAVNRGVDYVVPYYRDLAMAIALGCSALDFMLGLFARRDDPWSAGRQMPCHFSDRGRHIISGSSTVATQVPQAAGLALAVRYRQQAGLVDPQDETQPRLALTSLGEGSTNQGEWHEGMNWAGVQSLPLVCLVENNRYAISVPQTEQMAIPSVATRAASYGAQGESVDGNDVLAVYDAMHAAVQRAYRGEGPSLVEAHTYRLTPHTSDDDDRSYRSREEVAAAGEVEPLVRYRSVLLDRGLLTTALADELEAQTRARVDEAQRAAEASPEPAPEEADSPVLAPLPEGPA
ncbi:MAG: thiamine pyrophosphate-dependent dehydrogenase E1 component subunit alpha [Anaerolineaceae bacterium]|nr:thiamine pyrophosphate-dependent dehydrogenase E1 component subunit alpha [Anaerolineaceae bacterium]